MSSDMIISLGPAVPRLLGVLPADVHDADRRCVLERRQGTWRSSQEPTAQQMIAQFLGTQPNSAVTPPLDAYGSPITVPSTVPSSASGSILGDRETPGPLPAPRSARHRTLQPDTLLRSARQRRSGLILVEALGQGVPRQGGALDAHGEFDHALESGELP